MDDITRKENTNDDINKTLTCVLFPGVVKNDEKAIQCLGGIRNVSQVYSEPSRRLGLSFHPGNQFNKKTYADPNKAAGLYLKVRIRKKKENGITVRTVINTEIMGRIHIIHQFDSLCDFQYLPQSPVAGVPTCIYGDIIPAKIESETWLNKAVPYFLVPAHFTRVDKVSNYFYSDRSLLRSNEGKFIEPAPEVDDDLIRSYRSRAIPHRAVSFNLIDQLPTTPMKEAVTIFEFKCKHNANFIKEMDSVKKLFEERPIWSRNGIRFHTQIESNSLKVILPCIGVYFLSGPWRALWVRFGYDPRKEPSSRIYQSFDYRLRNLGGLKEIIQSRDMFNRNWKLNRATRKIKRNTLPPPIEIVPAYEQQYTIGPGILPAQRQTFYQYCDIKLPEIEEMVQRLPEVVPGAMCHPRRGWLPPSLDQQCREIINSHVAKELRTQNQQSKDLLQTENYEESDDDENLLLSDENDETIVEDHNLIV